MSFPVPPFAGAGSSCPSGNPRGRGVDTESVTADFCLFRLRRAQLHLHANGEKLIGELAALSPVPGLHPRPPSAVHRRRHPGAEMGLDQRLHRGRRRQAGLRLDHRRPHLRYLHSGRRQAVRRDRLHAGGALHPPQPYAPQLAQQARRGKGWSYPPKDYAKWAELVRQWVLHSVERYGKAEVETWYWELWNEPDICYWRGTPGGVRQALRFHRRRQSSARCPTAPWAARPPPDPSSRGPPRSCSSFWNTALRRQCGHRQTRAPLDFITYHAKGSPRMVGRPFCAWACAKTW